MDGQRILNTVRKIGEQCTQTSIGAMHKKKKKSRLTPTCTFKIGMSTYKK